MTELIQLPTGTDHRGLHLKPPHGVLIADGVKTQIAKARPFDLSGPWILVSGGMAYGTMEVGLPEPCNVEGFDKRFGEHRVSTSERKKWWTGKDTLYLSPITEFEPFKKTVRIRVVPGMQTVVESVEFITTEPDLQEHCEQVRLVIEEVDMESGEKAIDVVELPDDTVDMADEEVVEAVMGPTETSEEIAEVVATEEKQPRAPQFVQENIIIMPEEPVPVVSYLPNALDMLQSRIHKSFTVIADDLLAWGYVSDQQRIKLSSAIGTALETFIADLEALSSDIAGSLAEQLRHTQLDDTHALIMASKEENPMPYDPKNPPAKVQGMPEKAQRIWVHAYNSAAEKYPDDTARCHKIAYGAVKNAGYYQDEDGNWHAKKELGEGVGVGGPRQGVGGADICVCPSCGHEMEHERGTPCAETECPECGATMQGEVPEGSKDTKNVWAWLKQKFDGILGDLRGQTDERLFITFKGKDGRPWLLVWTTNAFQDRDKEIFRTKAIEEYVTRHADDEVKGEFWFWHLPGAKMGEIQWQAVVGRFLVQAGPFDDTPIGQKMAEFFSQHPHDHPEIAPGGWGTSHGYHYVPVDRKDKIYDWFDTFETTVLPKSAASNQHSPRMEVLPMDDLQRKALAAIAGDEFVQMIIKTGEERTKELEEQGVAFKETAADPPTEADKQTEEVAVEEAKPEEEAEVKETEAQETEETEVKEATGEEVDSQIKALAQQIVAGLNLGEIAQAIKSVQDTVGTIAESQEEQDKRIKALEDIGGEQAAPLIPLPRAAYWQASRVAQTEPEEKMADKAQPQVPDAIAEMAKRIPI